MNSKRALELSRKTELSYDESKELIKLYIKDMKGVEVPEFNILQPPPGVPDEIWTLVVERQCMKLMEMTLVASRHFLSKDLIQSSQILYEKFTGRA